MGNLFQAFQNFMAVAKQKYGQNFDPKSMCMNMLGTNCSTPQQALQELFNKGKSVRSSSTSSPGCSNSN